jgi:hypothetical protein
MVVSMVDCGSILVGIISGLPTLVGNFEVFFPPSAVFNRACSSS